MERDQLTRDDFPKASGAEGFDVGSVAAHLTAIAAHVDALKAQIAALEVEREALRRQLTDSPAAVTAEGQDERGDDPRSEETETDEPGTSTKETSESEVAIRLTATRLALEGLEREEIRDRLAADHGIEDLDSLLDDVLAQLT